MTRLTVFSSSDTAVAEVSANGLVEFHQSGEVAILCRYLIEMEPVRLTYLEPRDRLRLAQPAGEQLRRQARLRQAEDAEHPAVGPVHRPGIRPPGLPRRVRHPADAPRKSRRSSPTRPPNKRAKLIDTLLERPEYADFWTLKWSDVLRSNRKTIQVKGIHVFQHWLRAPHRQEHAVRPGRARADHGQRQHLRQPAGQLLPHRPRSAEPGRDDGPAVLRHPHAVRQVPQSSLRALDAGRLLQHGRLLRPREARRTTRAKPAADQGRRAPSSSTPTAPAK